VFRFSLDEEFAMRSEMTSGFEDSLSIAVLPDDAIQTDDSWQRLDDIADRIDDMLDRLDVHEAESFIQSIRQRSAE
jgi:hypothetical protein